MYLHARLDYIDRRIAENGSGSGYRTKSADNKLRNRLLGIAATVPVLHGFHHKETDRLVGSLLHDSSC